jgi:hypothetical protein
MMFSWAQPSSAQHKPDQEADAVIETFDASICSIALQAHAAAGVVVLDPPSGLVLVGDDPAMGEPGVFRAITTLTAQTTAPKAAKTTAPTPTPTPTTQAPKPDVEDDEDEGEEGGGRDLPLWVVEYVVAPEEDDDGEEDDEGGAAGGGGKKSGRRRASGSDRTARRSSSSSGSGGNDGSGSASLDDLPAAPTHRAPRPDHGGAP